METENKVVFPRALPQYSKHSRYLRPCVLNWTKLLKYPLILSFLPQPDSRSIFSREELIRKESIHSDSNQQTTHGTWWWGGPGPEGKGHLDPSIILNADLLPGVSCNSLGNQNIPGGQFTLELKLLIFIRKQSKEWAVVPPFFCLFVQSKATKSKAKCKQQRGINKQPWCSVPGKSLAWLKEKM